MEKHLTKYTEKGYRLSQQYLVKIIQITLPEVTNLSDRLLVCRQDRVVEGISPFEATKEKVLFTDVH